MHLHAQVSGSVLREATRLQSLHAIVDHNDLDELLEDARRPRV
jgi:hypothetical protein